jgi:hypothetical protein
MCDGLLVCALFCKNTAGEFVSSISKLNLTARSEWENQGRELPALEFASSIL